MAVDKYDSFGEHGYTDEEADLRADEVRTGDEIDDLTTMLERQGIAVSQQGELHLHRGTKPDSALDASEGETFNLTTEALDNTTDPVRLYLREMGTVPLLTRHGEIGIAKRFEGEHLRVLKAFSRSPVVIQELMAIGADLTRGVRSIKDLVAFDESASPTYTCPPGQGIFRKGRGRAHSSFSARIGLRLRRTFTAKRKGRMMKYGMIRLHSEAWRI